ncbi:MAG: DUF2059 domain-containing protein [Rhodopseudomonas sp.]|uniref:DUF2059 domain-containing protein n=1 Tax=Rhodopseudomonas sp. TaxID=1078 RepID=UPI001853FB5C|nr:DUF2059 domain-containing protein [Rhodopseudomonas sp.]NVN86915.1 DUF2059 domain-containing protein [Rhodopseudomonas sp.]
MNYLLNVLFAAAIALGMAFSGSQAQAQATPTPGGIAAAKELMALKKASVIYANAVPGMIQRVKDSLLQNNLNYQKDLNEVALVLAKKLAGRENEIGDQMAKIYASDFTEQELKDLVVFYKSPLGQKLLTQEPAAISASMSFMSGWAQKFSEEVNGEFRGEMRKRGKEI